MSLVVEDGTGLATAESYISVADADTYMGKFHAAGHAWNSLVTADKERHLRKAAQFLDGKYRHRFIGVRSVEDQALLWPRNQAYDADGYTIDAIPTALKNAQVEVARRLAEGTDMDPDLDRGGMVQSQSIGPLSVSYAGGAPGGKTFKQIDRILGGLIFRSDEVVAI